MERLPELLTSVAVLITAIAGLIRVIKPKKRKRKKK